MRTFWVIAACAALVVVTASGCRRPCTSPASCVRSCDCVNGVTNQRQECAIAYRCDGAERVCEEAHDALSCAEQCELYAANARCGVQRCTTDIDCQKVITCPILDQNGQQSGQFFDCTLNFRCQAEFEACQPRSTAQDAALCQNECITGVIPDE